MKKVTVFILMLGCLMANAQEFTVNTVTTLAPTIFETSGLIIVGDKIITHNDSGGGHYLHEIDSTDGSISRTVVVANAINVDWEDLCNDTEYIYIGDFGNNAGTRTDLRIYRIAINDYLTTTNDTVYCDTIAFNYADQVDFEPASFSTNFDAEAFIAYNDSLYLFTKNWGDLKSNVYAIPKTPGTYTVSKIDELNPEALVTGATYDAENGDLFLTAYTFGIPVLYYIYEFEGTNFSEGISTRGTPTFEGSVQIEGTTTLGNHEFLVSAENEGGGDAWLHRVKISNYISTVPLSTALITVFPTLVHDFIYTSSSQPLQLQVINLEGKIVAETFDTKINLEELARGTYLLVLKNETGVIIERVKFIKL